ncbi:hypothetical protein JMJ77_0007327, partial [Colletotrichum scovillei]
LPDASYRVSGIGGSTENKLHRTRSLHIFRAYALGGYQ